LIDEAKKVGKRNSKPASHNKQDPNEMRVLFVAWLCLLTLGVAVGATLPMKPAMTLAKRLQAAAAAAPPSQTTTATVLAAATKKVAVGGAAAATRPAVADLVAKALGYVIGTF